MNGALAKLHMSSELISPVAFPLPLSNLLRLNITPSTSHLGVNTLDFTPWKFRSVDVGNAHGQEQ